MGHDNPGKSTATSPPKGGSLPSEEKSQSTLGKLVSDLTKRLVGGSKSSSNSGAASSSSSLVPPTPPKEDVQSGSSLAASGSSVTGTSPIPPPALSKAMEEAQNHPPTVPELNEDDDSDDDEDDVPNAIAARLQAAAARGDNRQRPTMAPPAPPQQMQYYDDSDDDDEEDDEEDDEDDEDDMEAEWKRRQEAARAAANSVFAESSQHSEETPMSPKSIVNTPEQIALMSRLQRRPSKVELQERNILKQGGNAVMDGSMMDAAAKLSFEQRRRTLKSILKKRSERAELEEKNILKAHSEELDSSLVGAAQRLARAQLADHLNTRLESRPTIEQLVEKGLVFNETVEVLPTYRRSEYNRRPDSGATFRKLTPKLKMEIREELNMFKRYEMAVHEESMHNTAYH